MDNQVFEITDQINTVKDGYKHVVILGAGASKASSKDNPEKFGRSIPLMNDLPKIIDLDSELKGLPKTLIEGNFEKLFSSLFETEGKSDRLTSIEKKIYDFFSSLKLPDTPTIYDYLVLSLREKDLIATFNWDPFLWQAIERNRKFTKNLPQIAFLHGNVAIGICNETKTFGPNGYVNLKNGKPFKPTQLLYPIENKDYNSNVYIQDQWNILSHFLKSPARVSIFGYSAPISDIEAISIMKKAWGETSKNHRFTQFEIIDIQKEEFLKNSWKDFIFSHHYEVTNDFFKSTITRFPRRSGEVFHANYIEAKWFATNYPPKFKTLEEMWEWYQPLINKES